MAVTLQLRNILYNIMISVLNLCDSMEDDDIMLQWQYIFNFFQETTICSTSFITMWG